MLANIIKPPQRRVAEHVWPTASEEELHLRFLGLNWGVTHLAVKHSTTPHFSTSTRNAQRQDASVNIGSAAPCQGCHQAPNKLNAPKTLSPVVPRGK